MNLAEAQALLPSKHPVRAVLAKLVHADAAQRDAGYRAIGDHFEDRTRKLGKKDALAFLRIATELPFPPQQFDWNDSAHELIFPLVTSPHPALLDLLVAGYPRLASRAQCAVLAAIGAIGTRRAAEAFMQLIRTHGWPKGGVYGRVFTELSKLTPFADVLFPELVLLAGKQISGVTDALISALAQKQLDPAKVDLSPLAPLVIERLRKLLPAVKKKQKPGTRWISAESYYELRAQTGCWLDIAGHVKDKAVRPLLKSALALRDEKLVAFAAISLVRHRQPVSAAKLLQVAASDENRVMLFDYLSTMKAEAKFPAKFRTWEAFARAEMVGWLLHPSELGHVPDAIELMQRFDMGKKTLFVWKFKEGKKWMAGVSGVYELKGKPHPVYGSSTFSRFDRADAATPEQHANAVLGTLAEWAKANKR